MIWKRNEDRPKSAASPFVTFKAAITSAINAAHNDHVLAVEMFRFLDMQARMLEHQAAMRNAAMGGR
jgi:hypothetical protein